MVINELVKVEIYFISDVEIGGKYLYYNVLEKNIFMILEYGRFCKVENLKVMNVNFSLLKIFK